MSRLNKNPTLLKIHFSNWNAWTPLNEFFRAPKCFVGKQILQYKKLQFLQYYCYMSNWGKLTPSEVQTRQLWMTLLSGLADITLGDILKIHIFWSYLVICKNL